MVFISYFNAPISNILPTKNLTVLEVLEIIKSDELKPITEELRAITNGAKRSEFKKTNFPGVTFSGTFNKRIDKDIEEVSDLVCVDLDDLQEWHIPYYKKIRLPQLHHVCAIFISPSGNGIKIVFRVNSRLFSPKQNYEAAVKFLIEEAGIEESYFDKSCSNLSRLCFLCHDPNCYINPLVLENKIHEIPFLDTAFLLQHKADQSTTLEISLGKQKDQDYGKEITIFENPYLDINELNFFDKDVISNFHKLFKLNTYKNGEYKLGNRHLFIQRLASLSNHFGMSKDALKKHCENYLKIHPSTIDSSDPFDFQREAFGTIDDTYERYKNQFSTWKEDVIEEEYEAPSFPKYVYENLPEFIKKACLKFQDDRERDVFLLGTLGVLSNCFPNVKGRYNDRQLGANLFILISAPASAGKGILYWSRIYGREIHKRLQQEYNIDLQLYEVEMAEWNKEKQGPRPKKPLKTMFIIPGNISSSGIVSTMSANKDFGLIFETETDTLSNIMKNDWANFSDVLRKAFHHEPVQSYRKTNDEHIQIEKSFLSVVMSGTPNQLTTLLSSIENGFFSRLCFYDFNHTIEWKDVFQKREEQLEDFFDLQSLILANVTTPIFNGLKQDNPAINNFDFTSDQQQKFNTWFEEKQNQLHYIYGDDIVASVRRLAVMFYRFAMIFTILRTVDSMGTNRHMFHLESQLMCNDTDYKVSEKLTECLLHHTLKVFRKVKKRKKNKYSFSNKEIYFNALSYKFDFKESQEVGRLLGQPDKTSEKWLKDFVNENRVQKPARNVYIKK